MKKNLILVETLHTGSGLEIMRAAIAQNIHVIFLTSEMEWARRNIPVDLKRVMTIIPVDWRITSVKAEVIKLLNLNEKFVLYTQRDAFIEAVARVSEELGMPFTSAKAVHIARNKYLARELFQNSGLASPHYLPATTLDEFHALIQLMPYPFIVKPIGGSGSKDVVIVTDEYDLPLAESLFTGENTGGFLIEEFKVGPLVSVESFSCDGKHHILGVTNRLMSQQPYFVELGYAFPCHYPEVIRKRLEDATKFVLEKLDYRFGFCHTEFVLADETPYMIEVNPRLGGLQLGKLMSLSFGVNVYDILVNALFDESTFPTSLVTKQATAGYVVYAPKAGIIKEIKGMQTSSKYPHVHAVYPGIGVGDYAKPTTDMMGYVAQVVATGPIAEQALVYAHSASTAIMVEVEPESESISIH